MDSSRINRQWGWFRILEDEPDYKIKELVILPNHTLRAKIYPLNKHWFILKGACEIETVYLEQPQVVTVKQSTSYEIGAGVWHLARNVSDEPCYILEVRYGNT